VSEFFMRLLKSVLTYEHLFYALALFIGLDVSAEAGILVMILWEIIKLNDRLRKLMGCDGR